MFRIVAVAVALPTLFAAWAGPRIAVSAQKPAEDRVTLAGCVARQTGAGTANTAAATGAGSGPLLLTRVVAPQAGPGQGAVPGTAPTGSDTGTIGARAKPDPGDANERSYELTGTSTAGLDEHVGKRVEIIGTLVESRPVSADTAHPSSPRGRVRVMSFRPLGGACPLG